MFPFRNLLLISFANVLPLMAVIAPAARTEIQEATALAEMGFPAVDRVWRGEDYAKAASMISTGKVVLPKFSDLQGLVILKRLLSVDNLASYRQSEVPIGQRFPPFFQMTQATSQIFGSYAQAADRGEKVGEEIAHLTGLLLRQSELGLNLTAELGKTLTDQEKIARKEGLRQFQNGTITMFTGAEQILGNTTLLSPQERSLLVAIMKDTLPTLSFVFPADVRIEFRKKLEARMSEFSNPKDQANLTAMIELLKKAN